MNVVTRGIKNALRSPLRSGAIVIMLAISVALILSMLVARSSVNSKINEVKAATASTIAVRPAGIMGNMGGGEPLTAEQVKTIQNTAHVSTVTSTLTDQLGTSDTNLTSSLELGSFGARQQRFESSGSNNSMAGGMSQDSATSRPAPTPRISVTGTTDANSAASNGGTLTLKSGVVPDMTGSDTVALVGSSLATKNNLSVGSTFTAYTKTITVKGIYETGNTFQDSGIIMPLAALQSLTDQTGAVSSATVTVDSSDNVSGVVDSLKSSLGSKADITSEADRTANSLEPLQNIASLALYGVIGAAIAGACIILLTMIIIVRERRREIGVIKAIGGTNTKVVGQFITESLTLTIIGGLIGLGIGVAASGPITSSLVSSSDSSSSRVVRAENGPAARGNGFQRGFMSVQNNFEQVTATLTPQAFAISIGIMLLIAIVGSAIPAWFIARIRPAEVLRTE